MEDQKKTTQNFLEPNEVFSYDGAISRQVNWTNSIKKWMLETPSFFPYFRSWYYGKDVAKLVTGYELQHVSGLVSNDPAILQKVISTVRQTKPTYDPIAMIDPQSEALYHNTAEHDRKAAYNNEGINRDIMVMLSNRSKSEGGFSIKKAKYNDILRLLYDPDKCAGWLDGQIMKQVSGGAKIGVPMLPFIVDEESKRRWKAAYEALERFYINMEAIHGTNGIPVALHVAVGRGIFKEANEQLAVDLLEDIEELKPKAITVKVAYGAMLDDTKTPEQTQNTRNFLEGIGRFAKAANIPTHLFCENNSGVMSLSLGMNTYSQPIDHKVIRTDFAPESPLTLEERYGKIYDYKQKNFVSHKSWLTQSEQIGSAPCSLKCCAKTSHSILKGMSLHDFYHYAGTHLIVTRDQEIGEYVQALRKKAIKEHLTTKYRW